ncbi:MAG: MFS transporter, partial [Thermoproteales archaeon]|nr:MFS transporter [Thermoproteales archaeon]
GLDWRGFKTAIVVMLGWAFEALDFMLFPLLSIPIMDELYLSRIDFSLLISMGLLGTVIGGIFAGIIADRTGRRKTLFLSLLIYSIGTLTLAFSRDIYTAGLARIIVGLGLSFEWSTGMALVSETSNPKHRGKAVSLAQSGWPIGVLSAIFMVIYLYPIIGWRMCFFSVALTAPIMAPLFLGLEESRIWRESKEKGIAHGRIVELFSTSLRGKTLVALTMNVLAMFSYWMFWTWLPTYLYEIHGLSIVKSAEWLVTSQVGAWIGYISYGILQDYIGRRFSWSVFTAMEASMILLYVSPFIRKEHLLYIGFLLGFFTGFWGGFGALLSEIFPTHIRGTALGFIFNTGRAINFVSPTIVAWVSLYYGWEIALSLAAVCSFLISAIIWFFPETRGTLLR